MSEMAITGKQAARIHAAIALILAIAIVATLVAAIGLRPSNFDAPIHNVGDTLWNLVIVKAIQVNGWVYHIPQLGAPYALSAILFPASSHFDWLVTKTLSSVLATPGGVLNALFIVALVTAGISAYLCFVALGISTIVSLGMGFLYALLPFAFGRNTAHIVLTYFCVPPICLLCAKILGADRTSISPRVVWFGLAAAFVQGMNYIYFTFFSAILISFVLLVVIAQRRARKQVKLAALFLCVLLFAAILNHLPSVLEWRIDGKPNALCCMKNTAEAEIFGLKIRKLLAPSAANQVPGLQYWGIRDQQTAFPIENENQMARLGTLGMVGLLLTFALAGRRMLSTSPARSSDEGPLLLLTGICLLFGTVGGLGAVFNVLVVEDIRAYNRISVFISFLVFASLGVYVTNHYRALSSPGKRTLYVLAGFILFALSTYDQLLDAVPLDHMRSVDVEVSQRYARLVQSVEQASGAATAKRDLRVFMMPTTVFPPDPGIGQMGPYEHARGFIASRHLAWSWPVLSDQQKAWSDHVASQPADQLLHGLAYSDFDLIWLDTAAYQDKGQALIGLFTAGGLPELVAGADPAIRVFDLRPFSARLRAETGEAVFASREEEWLRPALVRWGDGFYGTESAPDGTVFRWSGKNSSIRIKNYSDQEKRLRLEAGIQSGNVGTVHIVTAVSDQKIATSLGVVPLSLELVLPPQGAAEISFAADMPPIDAKNDSRIMYFNLRNVKIVPL